MSALTDYRTDRFKQRKLALVVTPSEYERFDTYCDDLGIGLDAGYVPDPILQGHACLFYRMASGYVTWHEMDDLNTPDDMPSARLPFALLEDAVLSAEAAALTVEIQSRLRTIKNDIQFAANALKKLDDMLIIPEAPQSLF